MAGAGDNMKMVQEVGKAIVGPAYVLVASPARYYAAKKKNKKISQDWSGCTMKIPHTKSKECRRQIMKWISKTDL